MKPILYKADETNFNHNGIGTLSEAIVCEVTEERNGEFELYLEYPASGLHYSEIQELCLIKAKPNSVDDLHLFRIYERQLDTITQVLSVNATSISNDLAGNLVQSVASNDITPQTALDVMKNNLIEPTDFMFHSDINATNNIDWQMRNPLNCIAGEEGSLMDVFGGEIKRGNDFIWLYTRRGRDNVTTIRHGKNLTGLEADYSTKGLVTQILPYLTQTPEDSENEETVIGNLVTSQYRNNYPITKILPVDYSSDERVTDIGSLNSVAANYFIENTGIDKPSVKMEVDLDDLSDSSEFEEFKDLENIELCDTVTVYSKQFDVNITAKVTQMVFDVLREKNQSLKVGSIQTSFYDDTKSGYKDLVEEVTVSLTNTIEKAANGKNRIFRGEDEPLEGMSKNDVWYKPVGDGEIEMYVYDGAYWNKEAYSADSLGGTVNFANINAINLNLNALTTASITGANFWLNLITGIMQFTNPESGDTLNLDQAKIIFGAGTTYERILEYTSEGLRMRPGPNNTGTNLNTSLRLHGGVTYIDFFPGDGDDDYEETDPRARIETNGQYINLKTAYGESVRVVDWGGNARDIVARDFITSDPYNPTYHHADRWETPRDGNRSLVISPNGTGSLHVCNTEMTTYYPANCSAFNVASSRDFKKAIDDYTGNAIELINGTPVRAYYFNEDIEGVDPKRIGLIVQEAPLEIININGGDSIDMYEMNAVLWKGVQELSVKIEALETRVSTLEG